MYDETMKIPTLRADHHIHEDEAYVRAPELAEDVFRLREDGGIHSLDIDRLSILINQQAMGVVTLSAKGADPLDAYGDEFDLEPDAARRLANELIVAAHAADVTAGDGRG